MPPPYLTLMNDDARGTRRPDPPPTDPSDQERNRLSGRLARMARVGANMGVAAASYGANRLFAGEDADRRIAMALKTALGRTRGPLMKIAQMLATIPDVLPPEYAEELAQLQANAPAMGWSFVNRRMKAELGADWQSRFARFDKEAAHAASLGQVHRAVTHAGEAVAVKLQYPDMASAVEADVAQMRNLLGLYRSLDRSVDPSEVVEEIADRLREELDYGRERKHMLLYRALLAERPAIRAPEPVNELSSNRLLTMSWLDGQPIGAFKGAPLVTRNRIATLLFHAWWSPMTGSGVIHGDPHLGNYSVADGGETLNLLDFGCVRVFPPRFVDGVVALYRALERDDFDAAMAAYEIWGFQNLSRELAEVLNLWARFIYGPLLDDRVRSIADGISPGDYGRKEAFTVRRLLKERGPVKVPREFVFMDRAAIGLGAAFLHLDARLNFFELFQGSIEGFDRDALATRQAGQLADAGLA
jgi:predicted unusual protein kinase regulating ubiquinone biosynthesis (AarF/ABC1/UbiB family)